MKKIYRIAAAAMAACLVISGCGGKNSEKESDVSASTETETKADAKTDAKTEKPKAKPKSEKQSAKTASKLKTDEAFAKGVRYAISEIRKGISLEDLEKSLSA